MRSERVVQDYPISTQSMAALVKSAVLQNTFRCTCEEMLRQHSLHQQKAALSCVDGVCIARIKCVDYAVGQYSPVSGLQSRRR
jgi:hypothetical protein